MKDETEHIDTAAQASQAGDNKKRKRRQGKAQKAVKEVIQGRSFLSWDFFKRNAVYIVAATVMTLMYISNKFVCQSYMLQVMQLQDELENAKTDCVNASAKYNSQIRESQMVAFVDTAHIDLTAPEQPPYQLTEQ
ncbi:MAG: hypothetical protein IJ724_13365 [Muribaculaceae bacterium]|nr:hypothetical protein [Muribaculaceae bacterium]MBR1473971.1 hypothetical protein [Muribaculaceae bacterium]MBR1727604.1 hypothetical protein [Muribaculaceae bacterium]